ncbi:MAG: methionine biosynthesis protein MetW [Bryobacterales bacterium]|nr:methionine biosynthesis protein MetW [Bryobacterales bacterium]MDE0261817.1 methionine biosynthesis protein MetW [Bryobacterales bacterium]MDE0623815.1 methionine biosynthesis protein MetW [Bryobacterales bacterium]
MPVLEASEVATVPELLAREDHRIIADMIGETSTVLDLGCGEGDLLAWLARHKRVEARGVEIAPEKVRRCVELGLSVYQGDINQGLADYPDACFDYVILSQTLQVVQHPLELMREMRRVGRRIVVAFPNFGHWSVRLSLLCTGRAPRTGHLPYQWYDSPNIRVLTILDFEDLLRQEGLGAEQSCFLRRGRRVASQPNLLADSAIYLLS